MIVYSMSEDSLRPDVLRLNTDITLVTDMISNKLTGSYLSVFCFTVLCDKIVYNTTYIMIVWLLC